MTCRSCEELRALEARTEEPRERQAEAVQVTAAGVCPACGAPAPGISRLLRERLAELAKVGLMPGPIVRDR
ncbi:MAG: hypothetical protein ACRELV_12725 [Longimicrobiales bacterium]